MSLVPFQSFSAVGDREDLSDIISNISPLETPVFSRLAKDSANATLVEWQTDALSAGSSNKTIEGHTYTSSALSATSRLHNHTQGMEKTFTVSDVQDVVDKAGRESEYEYQMAKAIKQLAIDIEYNIINGTGNSGGTGTAREMVGIKNWITTNIVTGTGTGTEYLSKDMVDQALQKAYTAGGNIDMIVLTPFQQSKINAFTGITRNLDAVTGMYTDAIRSYVSSFGTHEMVIDRNSGLTDTVLLLESDKFKVSTLIPVKHTELPKVAAARSGVIETELTVKSLNEKASAKITGLKTS